MRAESLPAYPQACLLYTSGSTKKEDYNLDKVFQVEKWIFLVDAACSLGVGMNRFPDVAENILLVVFGVTLAAHVYVFKSKKFRKENE